MSQRVAITIGGSHKAAAHHPQIANADVVIAVDVPSELAYRVADGQNLQAAGGRLLLVPVGQQHTIASMAEEAGRARPDLRPVVEWVIQHVQRDATTGMQTIPLGGYLAGVTLVANGLSDHLYTHVYQVLLRAANGAIQHVEIMVFSSLPGATGRGLAELFGDAVAGVLHANTDAVVTVTHWSAGALSWQGISSQPEVQKTFLRNASTGVVERRAWLTETDKPLRQIRQMFAYELPMRGDQFARRDQDAALLVQAVCSSEFSHERDVRLGACKGDAIHALRIQQVGRVVPPGNLFAAAGLNYIPSVDALLRDIASDTDICVRVEATLTENLGAELPPVSELQRRVQARTRPNGLAEEAARRPLLSARWDAVLADGRVCAAAELLPGDAIPPTVDGYRQAVGRARGLEEHTERALSRARAEHAVASRQTAHWTRVLEERQESLFGLGLRARLARRIRGRKALQAGVVEAVSKLRESAQREAEAEARVRALSRGLETAHRTAESLQAPIRWLQAELAILAEGARGLGLSVEWRPLSEVFASLTAAVQSQDRGELHMALGLSLEGTNLDGLAALLGLDSADASAIVLRLAEPGPIAEPWPIWGGGSVAEPPHEHPFICLPRLAAGDLARLQEAASALKLSAQLVMVDHVLAGMAILQVDLLGLRSSEDLLTTSYAAALKEVLRDPEERIMRCLPTKAWSELPAAPVVPVPSPDLVPASGPPPAMDGRERSGGLQ